MIGVYCIWNNISDKFYIGSAIDVNRRIKQHLCLLRKNKHINSYLQRSFNKYKEENFDIFVLRKSTKEDLLADEQWCLDILKPTYNVCKIAGNTLGLKWTATRRAKQLKYLSNKPLSHTQKQSKSLLKNIKFLEQIKVRLPLMVENNKRKICRINTVTNVKKEFNSIKEASELLSIDDATIKYYLSGRAKKLYKKKYKFNYI